MCGRMSRRMMRTRQPDEQHETAMASRVKSTSACLFNIQVELRCVGRERKDDDEWRHKSGSEIAGDSWQLAGSWQAAGRQLPVHRSQIAGSKFHRGLESRGLTAWMWVRSDDVKTGCDWRTAIYDCIVVLGTLALSF